ncbi:RNA polymerase sigma factor [Actinomadura kijaniata]|uniref:RNA polymerase sigma factor n=1 Tax=Actinomadura kijaniata TaxID=46161 RepID=UPI003F1CB120
MDEDEFAELYERNFRALLGYALRRCASADDAADVVAETFAVAWRRAGELPEGDNARLWLYGAARRVLANHRRGEQRHALRTAALRAELAAVPVNEPDVPVVGEVFRGLPAPDRELLSLVAWEGLAVPEIAKVLGCSRNAVSIRLHRARKRFARALRAAGVDDARAARLVAEKGALT